MRGYLNYTFHAGKINSSGHSMLVDISGTYLLSDTYIPISILQSQQISRQSSLGQPEQQYLHVTYFLKARN